MSRSAPCAPGKGAAPWLENLSPARLPSREPVVPTASGNLAWRSNDPRHERAKRITVNANDKKHKK